MTKTYAVIGLGFGDEGKGATVDWLCREKGIDTVVRFSGGCQAGHNVVTPEGLHHTFSQFGSGTFAGARTVHTGGMMIEPYSFMREAEALAAKGIKDPLSLVDFDMECLVTTPYHWIMNRAREDARDPDKKHGSCGRGIGETRNMQINHRLFVRVADLHSALSGDRTLEGKLAAMRALCLSEFPNAETPDVSEVVANYRDFASRVRILPVDKAEIISHGAVLEGSQGILLDETWGFHPHTTWSDLTLSMWTQWMENIQIVGCTRSYTTRHGAGPFPTEHSLGIDEPHNGVGIYQGAFRQGFLDLTLLDYAITVLSRTSMSWGLTPKIGIVVNHLDHAAHSVIHESNVDLSALVREGNLKGPYLGMTGRYGLALDNATSKELREFSIEALNELLYERDALFRYKPVIHFMAVGMGPTHADRRKIGDW